MAGGKNYRRTISVPKLFFAVYNPAVTPVGSAEVTRLLRAWGGGDQAALDQLAPLVYGELRRLARRHMQRETPGHTLQTTALVHEAYLRLVAVTNVTWQDRTHFFAVSAQMMRRILLAAPRARVSAPRGGRSPGIH